MRPRTYTLATAGSKLTGPPEGYGRKKELQVKHWLVSARPAEEAGAPDITAEPSVYPNQSLDDVYKQLRDSTDNLHAAVGACDQSSRAEGEPSFVLILSYMPHMLQQCLSSQRFAASMLYMSFMTAVCLSMWVTGAHQGMQTM